MHVHGKYDVAQNAYNKHDQECFSTLETEYHSTKRRSSTIINALTYATADPLPTPCQFYAATNERQRSFWGEYLGASVTRILQQKLEITTPQNAPACRIFINSKQELNRSRNLMPVHKSYAAAHNKRLRSASRINTHRRRDRRGCRHILHGVLQILRRPVCLRGERHDFHQQQRSAQRGRCGYRQRSSLVPRGIPPMHGRQ